MPACSQASCCTTTYQCSRVSSTCESGSGCMCMLSSAGLAFSRVSARVRLREDLDPGDPLLRSP
eukprot:scaffold56853_cov23-Prasinocladus_malaysianus.AAC.1